MSTTTLRRMAEVGGNYLRHPMRTTTMLNTKHLTILGMLGTLALVPACVTNSGGLGALDDGGGGGDGDESGSTSSDGNSGSDDGGSDDGDPSDTGDTDDTGVSACEGMVDIGTSAARLMDSTKWTNATTDLLGFTPTQDTLLVDFYVGPFASQPAHPEARDALEQAAAQAAAQVPDGFVQCDMGGGCLGAFAEAFARAAWRRSPTADELAAIVPDTGNHDDDVRGVIAAVLSDPLFYELTETGSVDPTDATRRILDGRSIATRLSFLVWNSLPDAELLALADAGSLEDPDVRRDQIQRMLDAPQADRGLGDYVEQWLRLRLSPKNESLFPNYAGELAQSMVTEAQHFYAGVVLDGDGTWNTLLTADYSFVNGILASEVYGDDIVSAAPTGDDFEQVQLDPTRRRGILTLPALMAAGSHASSLGISYRGLPIRQNVLCQPLPPPPPDVDVEPIDPQSTASSRHEFQQQIVGSPTCQGCHVLFDPIHLAFDNYDPIGRWQTELAPDGSLADGVDDVPAEPYGTLVELEGPDVEFATREELTDALVTLPETGSCAVQQHMQFSFGRAVDDADACLVEELTEQYEASGRHLPTLIEDLAAHDMFIRVRL